MIRHHPAEDLLLALAAGHLDEPQALLVSVHLEYCSTCRARLADLQALGGVLLGDIEPVALSPEALPAALAAAVREPVDAPELRHGAGMNPGRPGRLWRPPLPEDLPWPAALRNCEVSRWRWIWLGVRWSRVRLTSRPAVAMFLLRLSPGRRLPSHSHQGTELAQVLCGSLDDGRAVFGPGDFHEADGRVAHRPIVRHDGECVCLVYVNGRLRLDGRIGSALRHWIGG